MAELREVQKLVDMLHGMIDEAKSAPFSSDKCMISRDEALDILEEISAALPLELKRAQELLRARDEFVDNAKKEAEKILIVQMRERGRHDFAHAAPPPKGKRPMHPQGPQRPPRR